MARPNPKKENDDTTKVIFRYWFPPSREFPWEPKNTNWGNKRMGDKARAQGAGEVIALFPEIPAGAENHGQIQSYQHVGQHGPANYWGIISTSVPATPEDYAALLKELKQIGYKKIKVYQKETVQMRWAYDEAERAMKA